MGQRHVNLFEAGKPPKAYPIISPHFQKLDVVFDPMDKKDPVKKVKDHLERIDPEARIILSMRGGIDCKRFKTTEEELKGKIEEITDKKSVEIPVSYEFFDVGDIVETELFKSFVKKLGDRGIGKDKKERIIETVIQAMVEARL